MPHLRSSGSECRVRKGRALPGGNSKRFTEPDCSPTREGSSRPCPNPRPRPTRCRSATPPRTRARRPGDTPASLRGGDPLDRHHPPHGRPRRRRTRNRPPRSNLTSCARAPSQAGRAVRIEFVPAPGTGQRCNVRSPQLVATHCRQTESHRLPVARVSVNDARVRLPNRPEREAREADVRCDASRRKDGRPTWADELRHTHDPPRRSLTGCESARRQVPERISPALSGSCTIHRPDESGNVKLLGLSGVRMAAAFGHANHRSVAHRWRP